MNESKYLTEIDLRVPLIDGVVKNLIVSVAIPTLRKLTLDFSSVYS